MADSSELRIVIFGKAKSNNTTVKDLLEENLEQGKINGRKVKMIEAPGIFDPDNKPKDLKESLISCIGDCAPGPHAFILVMKVGKYTKEEKELVSMINMCFGEKTLKYTALLYTHGQELKGRPIREFVADNDDLKKCVDDCGGGVHVIDSKCWNEDERNSTNLKNLLNSIGGIVKSNGGGYYTTPTLKGIEEILHKYYIKEMHPGETEASARMEMIKIVTPVLIGVPTLLLLSTLVGIKDGLVKFNVEQVILNAVLGTVKGGAATINIVKDSSDLYEVSDELKKKIKETGGECLIL